MQSFAQRFRELAAARSPLCLGIDPSADLLRQWGLPLDAAGLRRFCEIVMEAAGDRVAVVKPQAAFFEQFGPEGLRELARLVGLIRERGALALVDAKRGDFAETMEGYARAWLGPESGFAADAMTATAYLGFGALLPVLRRAAASGAAVFVVVRSSNPEGSAVQTARLADGRSVAEALADDITTFNAAAGKDIGPAGAVVGATVADAAGILARLPRSLLLAPGIGAQGATFADAARLFGTAIDRAIPSISRGILRHGPSVEQLRGVIERSCEDALRMRESAAKG